MPSKQPSAKHARVPQDVAQSFRQRSASASEPTAYSFDEFSEDLYKALNCVSGAVAEFRLHEVMDTSRLVAFHAAATAQFAPLAHRVFSLYQRSQEQLSSSQQRLAEVKPNVSNVEIPAVGPSAAISSAAPVSAEPLAQSTMVRVSKRSNAAASGPSVQRPPSPARPALVAPAAAAKQPGPQQPQQDAAQQQQRAPQPRKRGSRGGKRVQARRVASRARASAPAQDNLTVVLGSVERVLADALRVMAGLGGRPVTEPVAQPHRGRGAAARRRPAAAVPPARPPAVPAAEEEKKERPRRGVKHKRDTTSGDEASDSSSVTGMSVQSPSGAATHCTSAGLHVAAA
jgi:hypothetical protein